MLMELIGKVMRKVGDKPFGTLAVLPITLIRRYIIMENNKRNGSFI